MNVGINDDGTNFVSVGHTKVEGGLTVTKREWFAAMAMQGILSGGQVYGYKSLVHESVACADALIEELKK